MKNLIKNIKTRIPLILMGIMIMGLSLTTTGCEHDEDKNPYMKTERTK